MEALVGFAGSHGDAFELFEFTEEVLDHTDVLRRLAVLEASAGSSWRREAKDHSEELAALNQRIKQLEAKLAGADTRTNQLVVAAINRWVPGLIAGGIDPVLDEIIALEKEGALAIWHHTDE